MDLFYQYLNSSNAARALASATIVWRLLACLFPCIHQIHAIGGDKRQHYGEGVVRCLLPERRRDFLFLCEPNKIWKKIP